MLRTGTNAGPQNTRLEEKRRQLGVASLVYSRYAINTLEHVCARLTVTDLGRPARRTTSAISAT